MESRKVQKVGGSTYTVSVPKEWAHENDVEAGVRVDVFSHLDGSLVVQPHREDGATLGDVRVAVDDERPSSVERALTAVYAAGYESATLDGEADLTPDQRRAAREVARRLPGLEVTEESSGAVGVRVPLDASQVSVQQTALRLQFTAVSMLHSAATALTGGEEAARVRERAGEADRLLAMVRRHASRAQVDLGETAALAVSRPALLECYLAADRLAAVADHAAAVAGLIEDSASGLDHGEPLRPLAEEAGRVVEDAAGAAVGGEPAERAHAALDRRSDLAASVAEVEADLLDDESPPQAPLRALDRIDAVGDCGASLAETALQAAARRGAL